MLLSLAVMLGLSGTAPATFSGTVVATGTGRPVLGAEVALPQLELVTRTDSAGNFSMAVVSAGFHTVTVRALGFERITTRINFADDELVERDFSLVASTNVLATVDVTARGVTGRNPRITEFDERRKLGLGRFVTQAELEKEEGRKLSDILTARIPGLRSVSYGGRQALASSRGLISLLATPNGDSADRRMGAPARCYVQVIVDDIIRYRSTREEQLLNIDNIDPASLAAAEYYTVSQTPAQFNRAGSAACGTLVLWSRY